MSPSAKACAHKRSVVLTQEEIKMPFATLYPTQVSWCSTCGAFRYHSKFEEPGQWTLPERQRVGERLKGRKAI
jgi:hypothetical protein